MTETNPAALQGCSREERIDLLEAEIQASNAGRRAWREWKATEARELLELARNARRVTMLDLDIGGDLHAIYEIRMPVPREINGQFLVGDRAVFHLRYQEDWLWTSPAGWEPLGVVCPLDILHPNAAPQFGGAICLGVLPAGIRPKEIMLLGFYTVSLQMVAMDETDPHGVVSQKACDFYRGHPEYLPLTRAGLADPISMDKFQGS
jgi:hypothetical protein